jgi:hypothetical protein
MVAAVVIDGVYREQQIPHSPGEGGGFGMTLFVIV